MAINISDFNKIWASTSPLTPYAFSDANYQQGWNFVGSTPPARQMWDSYMKFSDEKQQYIVNNFLPLSGGTMTGQILLNPDTTTGNGGVVARYGSGLRLSSEAFETANAGALINLTGRSANTNAGNFSITANSSVGSVTLIGRPDGTLTWNGASIPERSYGISLVSTAGENTYTFSINTSGAVIFAKRGANCSCHMVTYWDSGSTKIFSTGTDPITITKSTNSNSVTITNAYSSAVAIKIINGGTL